MINLNPLFFGNTDPVLDVIEEKDPTNNPLHNAVLENNVEKIKYLLSKQKIRYYLFATNSTNKTPFDLLVENNKLNLITLFAPYCGSDSEVFINLKFTHKPIHIALKKQHFEMAETLWDMGFECKLKLSKFNLNLNSSLTENDLKTSNFLENILNRKPEIVRLLTACESNDLSTVKQILKKQPWLGASNSDTQKNPFGIAVSHNSYEVVEFLLAQEFSIYGALKNALMQKIYPKSVPIYEAILARSTQLNLMLDTIPDLPSLKEILREEKLLKNISINYNLLMVVFDKLIEDKDLDGILLLAKHPKTKETILREGIVRVLECSRNLKSCWYKEKTLKTMIQAGFDLNGVCKKGNNNPETPLVAAINRDDIELAKFFIEEGALLEPFVDPLVHIPSPFFAICKTISWRPPSIELTLFFVKIYRERKLPIPWNALSAIAAYFPNDIRLLVNLLEIEGGLTNEENQILAQNFSQLVLNPNLKITDSFSNLLHYGVKNLKTMNEWDNFILELRQLVQDLSIKFSVQQNSEDSEYEISRLINQIYYHIFCGVNPQLSKEPQVIKRITKLLLDSSTEMHDTILLALQVASSIDSVEKVIQFHEKMELGMQLPPSAFFKIQGDFPLTPMMMVGLIYEKIESIKNEFSKQETFKFYNDSDFIALRRYLSALPLTLFNAGSLDVEQTIDGWLTYFAVYRTRMGLMLCNHILKYQKNSPKLIQQALVALERIAIKRWNKTIENNQIKEIVSIIKTSVDLKIKTQAVKTLWALSNDASDEILKKLVTKELLKLNLNDLQQKTYALTLIDLLGNYDYLDSDVGTKTAKILRQLLEHRDVDIVYQTVITISKTDDSEGLLKCLHIIAGPVWDRHKVNDGKNTIHAIGGFLMFRHRPAEIHDNRQAMRLRILDRLAHLESRSSSFEFTIEIQRRYDAFIADPSSSSELEAFVNHFHKISRNSTRYVGMPLYFPSGCAIGRGLSSRKGEELFFESVRDLIRKGCGTTDLTLETSVVEGQTWGRIGHTFASHNSKLFDHEGTYFNGSNSAFLVIASDYFNSEFMRGDARMESEGTFNTLWYRGVPKKHLQAIFLEKQNQNDIELLSGNESIVSIKGFLTSPIFKDQTVKELVHLRRHLIAKDAVMVKGVKRSLSFAERIRYYDSSKKPSLPIEDVEDMGYKFLDEHDLLQESLKRAIGRQIIMETLEFDIPNSNSQMTNYTF